MIKPKFRYYRIPDNGVIKGKKGRPELDDLKPYHRRKNKKGNHWAGDKKNYLRNVKPKTKGGAVYCVLELPFARVITVAYCSMEDTFCYETGRKIAYARLTKLIDHNCLFENENS